MAEYIEREAVMQKFADHVKRSNNSDFAPAPTWNQAVQIVEDSPAADVREVVYCRECKHYKPQKKKERAMGEQSDDVYAQRNDKNAAGWVLLARSKEGGMSMGESIFAAVALLIGFFFGFLCGRSGT